MQACPAWGVPSEGRRGERRDVGIAVVGVGDVLGQGSKKVVPLDAVSLLERAESQHAALVRPPAAQFLWHCQALFVRGLADAFSTSL